ncbi:hypothetical protein [Streptomyces diastatochromogenes]|uniref:hypothetical protein n=1 Tax=Streptomyces diastatochromogenes TaxID=42236 RepID=UPI0036759CFD
MTPWLRLTLRLLRLVLVLATAVPVYGATTAYGAEAAPPDSPAPSASPSPAPSALRSPALRVSAAPAARSSSDASASPSAPPEPSRAGSRAGEGRRRPGRPDGPPAEEEGDDDTGPFTGAPDTGDPENGYPEEPETAVTPDQAPAVSPSPAEAGLNPARPPQQPADQSAVHQGQAPTEPTLQILPLGSGLVLIGLGLGLAFLGLRVRRG